MDQLAYFWTREIIKWVPFTYLKALKKLEYALYNALLAFILYSNSILCTFKSIQYIHHIAIYTIISCIILYSKSFTYILYSFWSHCEYILSTNHFILTIHTIKILFHSISNIWLINCFIISKFVENSIWLAYLYLRQ